MNILITGGAGYIGSHITKQLLETTNHNITILDNLSTGSKKTLKTLSSIRKFKFIKLDLKKFKKVNKVLEQNKIDVIMHFAASIIVPESVENPLKYYMNNTLNSTNLIKCATENGVKRFIFSSTAAVYGDPNNIPANGIDENYPTNPINPYGMSKLMSERVLVDTAAVDKDFKFVIFRYFNVAGADIYYEPSTKLCPRIGQSFPNATHLIKIASECAVGKRSKMSIFGEDYPTIDGTCVRDYIHVDDLADAHIKAIDYLDTNPSDVFNLGYGKGFSVKEVIDTVKKVTKVDFEADVVNRREGDSAILIADNAKVVSRMNWVPRYDNLALICKSAYEWERRI
ncbi:UDP-glucose 4-epimerase [Sulfurovum sp. enrichment culture clone C5]|uniref:UDP-glucose 4-epimerase n=1 Tax=Sulfurovum sp. enrichment culture clone C5 TaxID=497650 RepID=A0A0S4XQ38_9BACT|nr:UDP-glucose 4-epimerase [Sulfurovum sp. enrichment culture clone C5]